MTQQGKHEKVLLMLADIDLFTLVISVHVVDFGEQFAHSENFLAFFIDIISRLVM